MSADRPAVVPFGVTPSDPGRKKEDAKISPPERSLRTCALTALAHMVREIIWHAQDVQENTFLLKYLPMTDAPQPGWRDDVTGYLSQPMPADLPLLTLARILDLTTLEVLAVALAAAVEDDLMIGRVLAHLQAPVGGSRPTVGLLAASMGDLLPPESRPTEVLVNGPAMQSGLLTMPGDGPPLPERPVSVPLHLCQALAGLDGCYPGTSIGSGHSPEVQLPFSIQAEARRQALGLTAADRYVLLVRTRLPAEGKAAAGVMAQALNCRPLFLETHTVPGLTPWILLRRLLPVYCSELGPGERKILPPLPLYQGPVVVLTGMEGTLDAPGRTILSWSHPVPSRPERLTLWRQTLGNGEAVAQLARHRHSSGRIAHLTRLARYQSRLDGRTQPTVDEVLAASRHADASGLEALAQVLPDDIPDAALVMTPSLQADLEALVKRCRSRDGLVEGLGASATARYRPGVKALFVGPSGTGKTLAAGWLATKLALPLYRVDLAAVTSKYIGETEKNLAQLLSRAEAEEVVLLFDEADSLFGRRTEVQQANDRFANAQTNYLLTRLESFDGIALLTSNSKARFDPAFFRRLDLIVTFPLPGPEERRSLWLSHLGGHHTLMPQDINRLAGAADLAGGHIRNVVLAAAVLAQEEGRPISYADLLQGLESEYRKLGRQLPGETRHREL